MSVFINPGSGPVEGGDAAQALENVAAFMRDVGVGEFEAELGGEEDGRWSFTVRVPGHPELEIDMPGLALERVRYVSAGGPQGGQDPWTFPRLYVGGSSWLWKFAVEVVRGALLDAEAERSSYLNDADQQAAIQAAVDAAERRIDPDLLPVGAVVAMGRPTTPRNVPWTNAYRAAAFLERLLATDEAVDRFIRGFLGLPDAMNVTDDLRAVVRRALIDAVQVKP